MFFLFILCYQTDGSVPNTLVIANCEVVKPRVAAAEHISQVFGQFQSLKALWTFFFLPLNSCIMCYYIFSSTKKHAHHLWRSTRLSYTLVRYVFATSQTMEYETYENIRYSEVHLHISWLISSRIPSILSCGYSYIIFSRLKVFLLNHENYIFFRDSCRLVGSWKWCKMKSVLLELIFF